MRYTPIMLEVAFLLKKERLGRRSLAQRTGLSEMTVRLELERLQKKGLIRTDRRGVTLSALGGERFSPLLTNIKQVAEPSLHSLAQDTVTQVALLSCPTARPPWWYRDLVIREGGSALILIRYRPEGWCFSHNEEKVSDQNPHDERMRSPSDEKAICSSLFSLRIARALGLVYGELSLKYSPKRHNLPFWLPSVNRRGKLRAYPCGMLYPICKREVH
jgi:DNA-binding Lrp family transcriptional regulator